MFNLNDEKEFNTGVSILNGGNAGLVKDVTITVEKKQDTSNKPDYQLVVTDKQGSINEGFYYPTPNSAKDEEANAKYAKMQVGRVRHAAKAVMGEQYEFPQVANAKEAFDVMFKLIKENAGDKKFNVFTTYGTKQRPSQYLGLRYFDFIEPATPDTQLFVKNTDMMERITADMPQNTGDTESWI
jgi:hypothetical protein